jgi:hypothetical protein
LEIERRKLRVPAPGEQPRTPDEFRAKQLKARDLLRGDLEGRDLEEAVEQGVLTTTLEKGLNVARSNSIFPATFGLACCAIEFMSIVSARPEALMHGFNKLQRMIKGNPDLGWRQRYNALGTEEWARFESGKPSPEALEAAARAVESGRSLKGTEDA